jgi:hypothetical protein
METTAVEVIDPKQYGLEEKQATQIVSKLSQIVQEREFIFAEYEEVCKLEITHENIKKFKEVRKKIADNRTKELEPARKADKEYFLRGGQFVDASYKREIAENERRESKLKEAETYFERLEAQRIEELRQARIAECEPFQEFIPFGIDLGLLNEEGYESILNGAKMQHEAKVKAKQEAEAERLRLEEEARIEREKEAQRIEAQRLENERLRKEAEEKEKALQLEREKAAAEAERLRKESEAKLEAEQERLRKEQLKNQMEKEKLIISLNEKACDYLRSKGFQEYIDYGGFFVYNKNFKNEHIRLTYKKTRIYLESEKALEDFKATVDSEIEKDEMAYKLEVSKKAEQERIAAEEKARKEAEKLAKAPIKKQLTAWVEMFELPKTELSHELVAEFQSKHESMKNWCKLQIENL